MEIIWFKSTLNHTLYLLPTVTYVTADSYLTGFPDRKHEKVTIVNFVWLCWAIVILKPHPKEE